jgi:hypothetical protein
MMIHLKTLPVAPENSRPVVDVLADTLYTIADLVPAQINQTRKQIAQLVSAPATQTALAATTGALGASTALAGSVVAELAMSKIEAKVYELTAPTLEGRQARQPLVDSTRQELLLKAKGVDLNQSTHEQAPTPHDAVHTLQDASWTADPGITKEPESLLGSATNLNNHQIGSILDHAFGPKFDRIRERNRILRNHAGPILSRRY